MSLAALADAVRELAERVGALQGSVNELLAQKACAAVVFDEERADTIGQNGNDGDHYVDAGPTPLRGRVTRREE